MIQKVFLDTNVVVDLIGNREPFVSEAANVFSLKETYNYELYMSALSIANIACLIDQLKKRPHPIIAQLVNDINIVDLTSRIILDTIVSKFEDFEDGLQHASALTLQADVLVTRNKKDFRNSLIPVYSPVEFLALFKQ